MTDIDQAAALDLDEPRGRSPLVKWGLIGFVVLALIGAGGGVWYFFLGGRAYFSPEQQHKEVEAPLPHFMDLKAFVVSLPNSSGTPHFVQLGISLQLPRPAAAEMVTAILPEIQDSMRQTLLGFKSNELQTPEGVNRVRKAMIDRVNETINRVLGPERVAKLTAGTNQPFIQNILFATLIVE